MRKNFLLWPVLLVLIVFFTGHSKIANGQEFEDAFLKKEIQYLLPKLDVLIDSALSNSPALRRESHRAAFFELEAKTRKREWTNHFGVIGELNYGKWDYLDRNELNNSSDYILTQSKRTNWFFGGYVRFPLFALTNRKNAIKKELKMKEVTYAQKAVDVELVTEKIIHLYNNLLHAQKALRISNDYQQFTKIQMEMADNQYLQGELSIAEYARLKEIQTRGALDFEKIIADFFISYETLQKYVGFKFNILKAN